MKRLKNGGFWIAAIALVGGMLISPVAAHVNDNFGHLWTEHIKPKAGWQIVHAEFTVPANDSEFGSVTCPRGKRPTGGGVSALQPNNAHSTVQRVIESYPSDRGWEALIRNDASDDRTAHVYAICTRI